MRVGIGRGRGRSSVKGGWTTVLAHVVCGAWSMKLAGVYFSCSSGLDRPRKWGFTAYIRLSYTEVQKGHFWTRLAEKQDKKKERREATNPPRSTVQNSFSHFRLNSCTPVSAGLPILE